MKLKDTAEKIPPIYRLIAGLLILFAVFVFSSRAPYIKEFEESRSGYRLSFLQEGQYEFKITYEDFEEGEKICIYSDAMTDENNLRGVILAETVVQEHAGIVALSFSLSDGAYDIYVLSDSNRGYLAQGRLQSVRLQNRDSLFLAALFAGAACAILCLGWNDRMKQYRMSVLLLGIGIIASIPLFSDFLYKGYDIEYHLARIEGIYQAMRAGDFPVRLNAVQNAGYGDLSASMYPQLFLYPVAMLRFLGVSLMLCYKVLLVGINICSAFTSYHCAKSVCRLEKIGLWTSIFYTFASYRFIDIYMRHALGEALAMAFLPLVLWGTYEILWGDRSKWYLLVLGMTAVLQSHVLSTQMYALFMLFELVLCVIGGSKAKLWGRIRSGMTAVCITILLNAGFLIPFLYFSRQDLQCFHIENNIAEGQAYLTQLFSMFLSAENYNLEPGSTRGEMAISVGYVLLLGAILFCANQMRQRGQEHTGRVGRRCLVYGAAAVFLSSWLFPWEKLLQVEALKEFSAPLQFPWRFLGIATVMLCMTAAIAVVEVSSEKAVRGLFAVAALGLVVCSTCYTFDIICQQRESFSDKMELEGIDRSDSMYMYCLSGQFESWDDLLSREDTYIKCASSSETVFSEYEKRGTNISVVTYNESDADDLLVFPLCYYPGYVVRVDGQKAETKVYADPVPLVACELPKQSAHITVSYEGFWFFKLGDIISCITGASLVFMVYRRQKTQYTQPIISKKSAA